MQNGRETVITYASHMFNPSESNWSTYDKELIQYFRHYLGCNPFKVITDHKPLVAFRKIPLDNDPTGWRARWALEPDVYNYMVEHREERKYINADSLIRCPARATEDDPSTRLTLRLCYKSIDQIRHRRSPVRFCSCAIFSCQA